jgi:hypothetical protein
MAAIRIAANPRRNGIFNIFNALNKPRIGNAGPLVAPHLSPPQPFFPLATTVDKTLS